jgi:hypothetical protein
MRIATNVNRDAFGGITISNLALFDWLKDKEDTIIGIEVVTKRNFLSPIIFHRYSPLFFIHHIINAIDIIPKYPWERVVHLYRKWQPLIDAAKNILREESPDILLINGTYSTPWILTLAAKELGVPIVLRYAGVLKKETSQKSFFARKRLLKYERMIALQAKMIIFPSKICSDIVEKEILGHRIKSKIIIANPVKQYVLKNKNKDGIYKMAIIGRWTPIKNFPAFFALHHELLKNKWPHRAIIVTSDKKANIPETIEKRYSMSYDDLLNFYHLVDLVIVPSHFETFSNVAAEAVMNGTSVLVSKNVGFAEILIKAGLKRMVVETFDDPVKVARIVKKISQTKLSKKEISKVAALVNPDNIHENILRQLKKVSVFNC